jgi:hypothetical protein
VIVMRVSATTQSMASPAFKPYDCLQILIGVPRSIRAAVDDDVSAQCLVPIGAVNPDGALADIDG